MRWMFNIVNAVNSLSVVNVSKCSNVVVVSSGLNVLCLHGFKCFNVSNV